MARWIKSTQQFFRLAEPVESLLPMQVAITRL
jgi:hypothetical protein